jgi:hypothetical protein
MRCGAAMSMKTEDDTGRFQFVWWDLVDRDALAQLWAGFTACLLSYGCAKPDPPMDLIYRWYLRVGPFEIRRWERTP